MCVSCQRAFVMIRNIVVIVDALSNGCYTIDILPCLLVSSAYCAS